jgi:hypothetical protein
MESPHNQCLIDLYCNAPSKDNPGYDSDTLASPTINGNVESSSCNSSKKHRRSKTSPSKRPSKTISCIARCTDEITAMVKSLRDELAATSHTDVAMSYIQMQQPTDPLAALWCRIEAMHLTPFQRILIGEHLSTKDNKDKRGWLCNASDATLNAWVFNYLFEKEGFNL